MHVQFSWPRHYQQRLKNKTVDFNLYTANAVPYFAAKKSQPPPQLTSKQNKHLKTLTERNPALKKLAAYKILSKQISPIFRTQEKVQINKIYNQINNIYLPSGIKNTIRHFKNSGYHFYFKDTPVLPWTPAGKEILSIYEHDSPLAQWSLEDNTSATAGEILEETKELGSFVKGNASAKGYFLFNTDKENLSPSTFWHEIIHALQHKNNMYESMSKNPIEFYKREMEANSFVIDHAEELGLNKKTLSLNLKIWGLRLEEYLQNSPHLNIVA